MSFVFWMCVAVLEVLAFLLFMAASIVVWNFVKTKWRSREVAKVDDDAKAYIRYRGVIRQKR